MPTTPNYAIPYQSLTDPPNGASLGQDGFMATDSALKGIADRVTALENKLAIGKLGEQVLTAAQASVTFSSIPATYRTLMLSCQARGDSAQQYLDVRVRFNGDTAGNYDTEQVSGFGTQISAFEGLNNTSVNIGETPGTTPIAGSTSVHTAFFPWYAGTTFWKTCTASHALGAQTAGGQTANFFSKHWAGRWRNTAAINSITVFAGAGNFIAGSSFVLHALP